jgi:hypothetical protein
LRWDFGFTCALCLLHEADLYGGQPGEALGGTTVEHHVARSEDASREDEYTNCLYACRFCNRSRSAKPTRRPGVRLLDPAADAWSEHFAAREDRLKPVEGNPDAAYTHRAYELDDPRKVARRRARRELLTDRLCLLASLESDLAEVLGLAGSLLRRDLETFRAVVQEIRALRANGRRALADLRRYAAVPTDAPLACRCPPPGDYSLPAELESQTLDVPDGVA